MKLVDPGIACRMLLGIVLQNRDEDWALHELLIAVGGAGWLLGVLLLLPWWVAQHEGTCFQLGATVFQGCVLALEYPSVSQCSPAWD